MFTAGTTTEYAVVNTATGVVMFTSTVKGGADVIGSAEWYASKMEAETTIKSRTVTVTDWS